MAEAIKKVRRVSYVDLPVKQAARSLFVGIGAGVLSWAISRVLLVWVFTKVFCGEGLNVDRCANAGVYADSIALILVAIAGIYFLVRFGIYRPLVVVVASVVALWPLLTMVYGLSYLAGIIICAIMFGLAYLAFTWLVRIRPIWLSIIFVAIVVVATRLILAS